MLLVGATPIQPGRRPAKAKPAVSDVAAEDKLGTVLPVPGGPT